MTWLFERPARVTDTLLHLILFVICRSTNRSFVNERAYSVVAPKTNLLCFLEYEST
jgi:hypothetical protein